jgi:hypothetical protein
MDKTGKYVLSITLFATCVYKIYRLKTEHTDIYKETPLLYGYVIYTYYYL